MSILTRVRNASLLRRTVETIYCRLRRVSALRPINRLFNSFEGTDNSITSSSQVDDTVILAPKKDNKSSRYFCANLIDSSLFMIFPLYYLSLIHISEPTRPY